MNGKGLSEKIFLLRQKLYLKAKREPAYRFYTLYEAVCRSDVLRAAWERVAANGGSPGVDGLSIQAVQKSEYGVVDGSVLKLIRMWLKAVIVEEGQGPGDPPKYSRSKQGTPQGGVISPLLANVYLHWFDKLFHRSDGPYQWANARLVRYADDFVILAKHVGGRIERFVEQTLQGRFGLTVNRAKTRTVSLTKPSASLDFLGYVFRYDRDLQGRPWRYLNVCPSRKSMQRERDALREMTGPSTCFKPIPALIDEINEHLRGWSNYFGQGYPRRAFRQINRYVQERLERHLKRRSQRAYRVSGARSWYEPLQRLGLRPL